MDYPPPNPKEIKDLGVSGSVREPEIESAQAKRERA